MNKDLMKICINCKNKIDINDDLCIVCKDKELEKCKTNPHYFATKYLTINGKPFTTLLKEKEFNEQFKELGQTKKRI